MKQDFLNYVKMKKTSLLDSPSLFFGCDTYRECFDNSGNMILKNNIEATIREYNRLDIWNRIWMYLTTPIHHYLVLSDIMALQKMETMSDIEISMSCKTHKFGCYITFMENIASDIQKAVEQYINECGNDKIDNILVNDRKLEKIQKQVSMISTEISMLKNECTRKAKP